MAVTQQLEALVAQMPDPDGRGMLTENIDKEKIDNAIAAICEGGPDSVRKLVKMLADSGSEQDVKPHYALHCLANHTLVTENEEARRQLCEVLADELAAEHSVYVKSFLCQTLQWAGRGEAAAALGQLLKDETLCEPAAMALVAIEDGAAEQLRAALAGGPCKLTLIHSLAALEDADSSDIFRQAIQDADREVRLAAGAGLAAIGDANSVDVLLAAADVDPGWERIRATKHCLVLAEKLLADGKRSDAVKIYKHLRETRTSPSELYVRELADRALAESDAAE